MSIIIEAGDSPIDSVLKSLGRQAEYFFFSVVIEVGENIGCHASDVQDIIYRCRCICVLQYVVTLRLDQRFWVC